LEKKMNLGLQSKIAVVSGSTAGIGLAIATALAAEGARVIINVLSGVRLTRKYLPGMLKKDWGRVIFISSESSQMIPTEMVHYGMTKTAQVAIARGLAQSVAATGVTVNCVLAGPTESEGVGTFMDSLAKQNNVSKADMEKMFFEKGRPTSLLKRFETPDEVAAVVAFVASTQALVMNGAAIRAEGGVISSIF
jgi:NAD(P)-dependent dehydrogenase (short-subunit alcohol dehydrogenase family)